MKNMYENKGDIDKAIHWYEKSAEQGNQDAQLNLTIIYGIGIEKDVNKAIYWYEKSAEQGNKDAQYKLTLIYKNGNGIDNY